MSSRYYINNPEVRLRDSQTSLPTTITPSAPPRDTGRGDSQPRPLITFPTLLPEPTPAVPLPQSRPNSPFSSTNSGAKGITTPPDTMPEEAENSTGAGTGAGQARREARKRPFSFMITGAPRWTWVQLLVLAISLVAIGCSVAAVVLSVKVHQHQGSQSQSGSAANLDAAALSASISWSSVPGGNPLPSMMKTSATRWPNSSSKSSNKLRSVSFETVASPSITSTSGPAPSSVSPQPAAQYADQNTWPPPAQSTSPSPESSAQSSEQTTVPPPPQLLPPQSPQSSPETTEQTKAPPPPPPSASPESPPQSSEATTTPPSSPPQPTDQPAPPPINPAAIVSSGLDALPPPPIGPPASLPAAPPPIASIFSAATSALPTRTSVTLPGAAAGTPTSPLPTATGSGAFLGQSESPEPADATEHTAFRGGQGHEGPYGRSRGGGEGEMSGQLDAHGHVAQAEERAMTEVTTRSVSSMAQYANTTFVTSVSA